MGKWDWLASTKVLLNVHRSDAPYFEWARVIEAAANGCVARPEDPDAGEYYRYEDYRSMLVEAPLPPGESFPTGFPPPPPTPDRPAPCPAVTFEQLQHHLRKRAQDADWLHY